MDTLSALVVEHADLFNEEKGFLEGISSDFGNATIAELRVCIERRERLRTLSDKIRALWPSAREAVLHDVCTRHAFGTTAASGRSVVENSIRSRPLPPTLAISADGVEKFGSLCTMCKTAQANMMVYPHYTCTNGAKSACECGAGSSYGVCEECWTQYAETSLEKGVRRMACGESNLCAADCPICGTSGVCIFRIVKIPPRGSAVGHRAMAQSLPVAPPPPPVPDAIPASATGTLVASDPAFTFPDFGDGGFDSVDLLRSDADSDVGAGGDTGADREVGSTGVQAATAGSSFVDELTGEVMHVVRHDPLSDLVSRQDMAARARAVLASFCALDESVARSQRESEERARASTKHVSDILVAIQEPKRTPSGRLAPACSNCHARGHYRKTCPALA